MTTFKVGDRIRLTKTMRPRHDLVLGAGTEGVVTGFGTGYPIRASLPGVDNYLLSEREFEVVAPPKPAEPTGLGAVVEDAEGNRWVRASQYVTSHRNDWHREAGTSTGADRRHYDGIPAVRVLSSGVES